MRGPNPGILVFSQNGCNLLTRDCINIPILPRMNPVVLLLYTFQTQNATKITRFHFVLSTEVLLDY
jgi:hypothetical protein